MRLATNIYHRKDGRFEARYANGKTPEGKTKYSSVTAKTYGEVKEKLERAKAAVSVTEKPAGTQTIIEAVAVHIEKARLRLKPSTINIYRRYLDSYISPHFGNAQCATLNSHRSQAFINELINKNGLAVVTVQSVFNLLKAAVSPFNSDDFVVCFPKQPKQRVEFLSVEEQKRIERVARSSSKTNYIAVMLEAE